MQIWKLSPIDLNLNHPSWKRSAYDKEVHVRAVSERRAREIAALHFGIAGAHTVLGEETPPDPWAAESALVSASEIEDGNYPDSGNEGIVGPPEALLYIDTSFNPAD